MKKKISSLKIENEQLKTDLLTINHNITVGYFNSLSLQQQKMIVFKIIQNSKTETSIICFTNLMQLVYYFVGFDELNNSKSFLSVPVQKKLIESNLIQIYESFIHYNVIENDLIKCPTLFQ